MNLFATLMTKQGKKHFDPDVKALAELAGAALANQNDRIEMLEKKVANLSHLRTDGSEG